MNALTPRQARIAHNALVRSYNAKLRAKTNRRPSVRAMELAEIRDTIRALAAMLDETVPA